MLITESQKEAIKSQLDLYAGNKQDCKDANERNKDIIESVAFSIKVDKKIVRKAFAEMYKTLDDEENSDLDEVVELIENVKS